MKKPKTFKVFVGVDEDDGRPLTWTAAFLRRDCQHHIREWLTGFRDEEIARVPIVKATLTLTPPQQKGGKARRRKR